MQRIPFPSSQADASPIIPTIAGGTSPLNISRMLDHLPPSVRKLFRDTGLSLMKDGRLDPLHRELAILRVGYATGAVYEAYHHRAPAIAAGMPEAWLDQLNRFEPTELTGAALAVVRFVDESLKVARVGGAVLDELLLHLSPAQVIELIVVIGQYFTLSRVISTSGIELDDAVSDLSSFLKS